MILSESPKAWAFDGSLTAWAVWVAARGASAAIIALTIAALILRVMILYRQWRRG